jgi:hypothetical protein
MVTREDKRGISVGAATLKRIKKHAAYGDTMDTVINRAFDALDAREAKKAKKARPA